MLHQVIKKVIYLNKPDYDYIFKWEFQQNQVIKGYPKKTRGTCIQGVMKNEACCHVILNEYDLNFIKDMARGTKTYARDGKSIYLNKVLEYLLPGRKIYIDKHSCFYPVTTIYNEDKYNVMEGNSGDVYKGSTYEFDMWMMDTWVECPKNKKELETIRAEEKRKDKENFNVTLFKDTVVSALQEAGIETAFIPSGNSMYGDRAYLRVADRKNWNTLVMTAINNYINGIAKEYNFQVALPTDKRKIKSTSKLNEYTPIFFLDGVEIMNPEGGQDDNTGSN